MVERIADASLGCEMNNDRKPVLLKKRFDRGAVRQVELRKGKVGMTSQYFQPALFEPRIVVAVDDIKANDPSSLRQQALGHMKPDKTGSSGDQHRVAHLVS